ncbi:hypothetical protein BDV93DRAFT_195604 [Ceratobasidium sp. AG-I]|nr:hypothetical protein BDV93DRAFT_195604 [Ceratobasidium sp. AG-I]
MRHRRYVACGIPVAKLCYTALNKLHSALPDKGAGRDHLQLAIFLRRPEHVGLSGAVGFTITLCSSPTQRCRPPSQSHNDALGVRSG